MRRTSVKRGGADEEAAKLDLTPMLDVVFIMLIFFIVTAVFVKEPGVEVMRPPAETAEKRDAAPILVAVTANNEIWIDKRKVEPRSVRPMLERLRAESPKAGMVVQADAGSRAQTVIEVLDAARELGITDVAVSTEDI